MTINNKRQLLVAAGLPSIPRVHKTLEGYFDYQIATNLVSAKALLKGNLNGILCGLDFDEGRMFDFLESAQAFIATRPIPLICIKGNPTTLSTNLEQGIEIAIKSYGAIGLIPLYKWRMELGDEQALVKLRKYLDDAIPFI